MIKSFSGQVVFCFAILRAISAYVGENRLSQYTVFPKWQVLASPILLLLLLLYRFFRYRNTSSQSSINHNLKRCRPSIHHPFCTVYKQFFKKFINPAPYIHLKA